jgi:hypothetical protein
VTLEITVKRSPKNCPECGQPLPDDGVCAACAPAPAEPEAPPPEPQPQPHPHAQEHVHSHQIPEGEEPAWIDHWENVQKLLRGFWIACGVLLAVDLLVYVGVYHKHSHFSFEDWPGFYGVYGFVACVALVLVAKQLRKLVMRGEDYYE